MLTSTHSYLALALHIISFTGDTATIYFNNNIEIIFLCIINSIQHVINILRIQFFGILMVDSPDWFCYFFSFINNYTSNTSITISCLIIFILYFAIMFPGFYSDYYYKMRPYIFGFTLIYNGIFELINLYEPLIKGYSQSHTANSFNCSSGYRHRFYQYILDSPLFNLPFNFIAVFCSIIIFYKLFVVPRKALKRQITTRIKMSFFRSIKVLCFCFLFTLIAIFNLYNDINNGIAAEKGELNESETNGNIYLFTACSGIIIFIFTNSFNQIKRKFGIKTKNDDSINDDTDLMLPLTQEEEAFDSHIYTNLP